MITRRPSKWHFSRYKVDGRKIVRVCTISLMIFFWAFVTDAGFAAERLCGAMPYFPPKTVFTAIVENGDILSRFEMVLTDALVLDQVPAELESKLASIDSSKSKKVEIISGQSITLSYPEVLKAEGIMAFARRGSLILQQAENYYLLEHEAGQKIAAVLRPGEGGVNVKLYPSPERPGKLEVAFAKSKNEIESVSLLAGTVINVPVNRPIKFEISLTNSEFLYDFVDFFHRANVNIKEPVRTPPKGTFTAVMRKQGVDFNGREFMACVRPANPDLGSGYFQIKDIEVLDLKSGQVQLALSLPQSIRDIDGFEWSYLATPIELRIKSIKKTANSDDVIMAEQRYYIGSPKWALIIAVIATLITYFLPLRFLKSQRRRNSSISRGLNLGLFTLNLNRSAFLSKEALPGITPQNYRRPFSFSPIWLGRTRRGNASLSSLQITIWTYLVFGIASYVFILNGQLINITSSILIFLGISGSASVASRVTSSRQDERAELITAAKNVGEDSQSLTVVSYPSWSDLISSGGRVDLARLQMLVFTILTAFYVGITAIVTFQFPEIPEGLLWLMGISNGVYLGGKVSEPSLANRLAEIDLERRTVESDLPVKKNTAENAKKRLDDKKQALDKIKDEIKNAKTGVNIDDLKNQQKVLEDEAKELETTFSEANNIFNQAQAKFKQLDEDYQEVVKKLNKTIDKEAGITP